LCCVGHRPTPAGGQPPANFGASFNILRSTAFFVGATLSIRHLIVIAA
jgi:hypothetical protein